MSIASMILNGDLCEYGGCGGCHLCEAADDSPYYSEDERARNEPAAARSGHFYAVRVGRVPGIYSTSDAAQLQVRGWPGADMRLFKNEDAARAYAYACVAAPTRRPSLHSGGGGRFSHYAVRVGRRPGIYRSNAEAQQQVRGVPGNQYKGFRSYEDAARYIKGGYSVDVDGDGGGARFGRSRSRSRSRSRGRGRSRSRGRSHGRSRSRSYSRG